ncbi:hypothetical protein Cgig2_024470 [Carnegiea gigantea]|uniref:TF-B3 domain-containing protein n=1 Tax=Carnegiea gigantea TaxID=171969 RepID=A0A9Q1KKN0_9CARY|nr:hypothetical protein Cgig2_024470 [Carnegiea gigantea]
MERTQRRNIHFINTNSHFFKPLLPDFLTNVSIPESFVNYLDNAHEENDEKNAILKDRREKTHWQVKIIDDGNDHDHDHDHGVLYFRDGWEEFCKDHGLQVGDLLVFEHKGHLVFDVSIFDPSACERELRPPLMAKASSSDHTRRDGSSLHGKQGSPCSVLNHCVVNFTILV